MKLTLIVSLISAVMVIIFVLCSIPATTGHEVKKEDQNLRKAILDSATIEIIEARSVQVAKSSSEEKVHALAKEAGAIRKSLLGQPGVFDKPITPSGSKSSSSKHATFSHESSKGLPLGSGFVRQMRNKGFPDIETQLEPEVVKSVSERYGYKLALATYEDSLLKVIALVLDPFGSPKFTNDLSKLALFSSRPRTSELPFGIAAKVMSMAREQGIWSENRFLCWLVPDQIEQQIMAIQVAAIKKMGLKPSEVSKTIGYYDSHNLSIRIQALETKTRGTILVHYEEEE